MKDLSLIAILSIFVGIILFAHYYTASPAKCDVSLLTNETKSEALYKCGAPGKINGDSYHEQWVYSWGFPSLSSDYVYIRNGKFSSAQWSR